MPDWSRKLPETIPLKHGKPLVTLMDAAQYMLALPSLNRKNAYWQYAAQLCLQAAESGKTLDVIDAHAQLRRALKMEGDLKD